jgi:Cys-rich four helix bundle protein (predicted Tat secretion target)
MNQNQNNHPDDLSRRDLLLGAGAAAALLASGTVQSMEHMHGDHEGHRHEDHAPKHAGLLNDVNHCVDKGQRCVSHCFVAFKEGDLTLADCASKAQEMLAICKGFSYLVTSNSIYLADYAKVCRSVCSDCERECEKHKDDHQECRDCMEACAKVVETINKVLA